MDTSSTSENTSKRIVRIVIVAALAVVAVVLIWPKAKESLAPKPERAIVAIQVAGAERAVTGPVEITPGTDFTLYAVLEAKSRSGEPVYYTEAPGLEIDGKPVPADALRRWDRPQRVKVFWFTVEGPAPYLKLKAPENLDRFTYTEFFRADWPTAWTIPGSVTSRFGQSLSRGEAGSEANVLGGERTFGTQRYQVRIELFEGDKQITPSARYISPGSKALPDGAATFSTVYSAYPGAAGPASLAFGLTEIKPPPEPGADLQGRLTDLTEKHLAFSRLPLIRQVLAAAGTTSDDLDWHEVDLGDGPAWSGGESGGAGSDEGVSRGDLLRAGGRVVVLFEDRGTLGRLDRQDLCFDFEQGAAVLPLSEVFVGEGLLELAHL